MQFNKNNNNGGSASIISMVLGVSLFILAVIVLVVATNSKPKRTSTPVPNQEVPVAESNTDKKRAEDLDIWNMYPEKEEPDNEVFVEPSPAITREPTPSPEISQTPEEKQKQIDEEMDDGNHIKVDLEDGTHIWVKIDERLAKNNYDYTKLVSNDGKLSYSQSGSRSFLGVDISRYDNDISFDRMKANGIDFVMIRVGARGYKTGVLELDETFHDKMVRAKEAGLDVGVYFYSQAINKEEALQEADLLITNIAPYDNVTYPVAMMMDSVENDLSRTETLKQGERTLIFLTFLNRIKEFNYKPMIYGNKELLLQGIDLKSFKESRVWLSDMSELPDYPYQFDMWQYTHEGEVPGMNNKANLNICFVDYSAQ